MSFLSHELLNKNAYLKRLLKERTSLKEILKIIPALGWPWPKC
jgi:hypothetical protein